MINLEYAPLGLDCHEPFDLSDEDVVWGRCANAGSLIGRGLPDNCVFVFPTEHDAANAPNNYSTPYSLTVGQAKNEGRRLGCGGLCLIDANLNVLREWPLTEGK